jgi:Domain of unknown function (DUF4249)
MKPIKIIIPLMFTLGLMACKKDITINFSQPHASKVFIEGMLYPGKTAQIFISKTNSFFSTKVTPQQVFAKGAVVKIMHGNIVDSLVADSSYNKFRCRWEPFYRGNIATEYGNTYRLEVIFEGNTYAAVTTISQVPANIVSVVYSREFIDVYGSHDGVIVTVADHPATTDFYRFQMNRVIDTSIHHAHVLDRFVNTCVSGPQEKFPVKDIGRIVFYDENANGQQLVMPVEVTYEYNKNDSGWIFIQSLDKNSADFYRELDEQLQAIQNPFTEPVFINTKIPGAIGCFGSAVLSDSVRFVFPMKAP